MLLFSIYGKDVRLMNRSIDLIKGNVFKSLVIFSLPFLFSNLFQQLYNTIDTYIVGNTLNEGSLAAIGACAAILNYWWDSQSVSEMV